jgi:hypothetical protein
MELLILHLFGDYVTQSDWMANGKTSKYGPALVHAFVYSLPFLLVTRSPLALLTILSTHFLIDRFRLAKYVCYAKNFLAPLSAFTRSTCHSLPPSLCFKELKPEYRWANCNVTGYPSELPPFMAIWLMIIADNTMHLAINYLSIRFL